MNIPSGSFASMAVANRSDMKRFGLRADNISEWSEKWIHERMSLDGPVGVLNNTTNGFVFETYMPCPQPQMFENLIIANHSNFSEYYIKCNETPLPVVKSPSIFYSDICCFRGMHSLHMQDLRIFLDWCERSLVSGGNLLVSFSIFLFCDRRSKETLMNSPALKKRSRQLCNNQLAKLITMLTSGKLRTFSDIDTSLLALINDGEDPRLMRCNGICTQNVKHIFANNFLPHEQSQLAISSSVEALPLGLWLKHCG